MSDFINFMEFFKGNIKTMLENDKKFNAVKKLAWGFILFFGSSFLINAISNFIKVLH